MEKEFFMDDRIIYLLTHYSQGLLTADETDELKTWIELSEHNREVFITFARMRKLAISCDMLRHTDSSRGWRAISRRLGRHRRRRLTTRIAAALTALVVAAGAAFIINTHHDRALTSSLDTIPPIPVRNHAVVSLPHMNNIKLDGSTTVRYTDSEGKVFCENRDGNLTYLSHPETPIYNTVGVDKGSTYNITLCDGTRITLASGARMTYPVGGKRRDVTLTGEAFFDVAPDAAHPFTVTCPDNVNITVLGTRFNVNAPADSPAAVTLESGSIALKSPRTSLRLAPGQQAIFTADGACTVSEVNARLYTSWAEGIYEFDNVPLSDIITELSLWYDVEFRFAEPELGRRNFTGVLLRNKNLHYTLSLLHDVSDLVFTADGNSILIN